MRSALGLFCIFSLLLIFSSCDEKRVYDEYKSVRSWHQDSLIQFDLGVLDTTKAYNLFIKVRNNNDYAYSNLFLITEIQFPEGKVISDTLEYEMAKPNGEWLGEGFGDVKESKLWYKQNVKFEETGNYFLKIKQAMRKNGEEKGIEELNGITHMGFRIENTEN